jgi:GNAT superfamily N-acetyltransferase
MPELDIIDADLARPAHAAAVVALIDAYARDPMGNGAPLGADVRERLVPALRAHPTTHILLACAADAAGAAGEAVGIAVCFLGFSTFAAQPLLNLHDLAVLPAHRGRGAGAALLAAVEDKARALGCCKVTLEVLEHNARARAVYAAAGFAQAAYQPEAGGALFLTKAL